MSKTLWRSILWLALALGASGQAHAYIRAYVVNDTGQAAYSLHVKLVHPAAADSAGSGYNEPDFGLVQISPDGMTLIFSNPLNAFGITPTQTVWIGWKDAISGVAANILSYYWTDEAGNIIGGVQYPNSDDTGDPSQQAAMQTLVLNASSSSPGTSSSFLDPPLNNDSNPGVNTDPTGDGTQNVTAPDSQTQPPDGQSLLSGGNDPVSTPEPAGSALLLGGLVAIAGWARRRASARS